MACFLCVILCSIFLVVSGRSADQISASPNIHMVDDGNNRDMQSNNVLTTASTNNRSPHCVIALDNGLADVLVVSRKASLKLHGCLIHTRTAPADISSTIDIGLKNKSDSTQSSRIPLPIFRPLPVLGSAKSADPLSARAQPVAGDCDHRNLSLKEGVHTLKPGVYCGGIVSLTASRINLEPGVYTIKDGPFHLGGSVVLSGEDVGFFLQGHRSVFGFGALTTIKLTAPKGGPLSGILFFEDRNSLPNREFVIRSKDAQLLEGAIYLPKGRFVAATTSRIGHASKWTSIVAHQIAIRDKARLSIRSNPAGAKALLSNETTDPINVSYLAD